jgi:hypothetical protein
MVTALPSCGLDNQLLTRVYRRSIFDPDVFRSSSSRSSPANGLALQLPFMQVSESMGNHDSKIVDAASVD